MKKHLLILFLITVVTRGVLFISYPMGGKDDDQSAQRFLISELLRGNLMIGNLRYNTGYPLVIAPVAALARPFGRLDDRIVLFVQVFLASTIPFAIYDVVRAHHNERAALIAALVLALDPFGLQWAHFSLPVWLAAFCLAWGLWCLNRARLKQKRTVRWSAAAGLVFGVACLARWEMALVVLVLGSAIFCLRELQWRKRLVMLSVLGLVSAGMVLTYIVFIHYPSTGIWKPSCMTGIDGILSINRMHIPVTADNGPATERLLNLLTLKPLREVLFTGAASYPGWRRPGPWAAPEEQAAFINQPYGTPELALTIDFPSNLIYYLGLCPTDALLTQVHREAILAYPIQWITRSIENVGRMLVNTPFGGNVGYSRVSLYLPRYQELQLSSTASHLADSLGFRKAQSDSTYTGQIVWSPGIWLLSSLYDPLNLLHWLALPALVSAFLSTKWLYRTSALALVLSFFLASAFNTVQARIYAPVYPLSGILIGGFVVAVFDWCIQNWKMKTLRSPINK